MQFFLFNCLRTQVLFMNVRYPPIVDSKKKIDKGLGTYYCIVLFMWFIIFLIEYL